MFHTVAKRIAPIAAGLALTIASPAFAATVYESATNTGVDTGEYIVQTGRPIGVSFTLSQTTNITGIGGEFGGFPSGSIYGAIVALTSPTAYPSANPSDIESIALAHAVFAAPMVTGADLLAPVSVTLAAGNYALIFGSGAFGATGFAGLGYGNATIGSPTMFTSFFDNAWTQQDADGIRIFVEGTAAVPEPASWALMLAGFGIVGGALRRRKVSIRFA